MDFWDSFDPQDNFILSALRKNFEVEISRDPDFLFCASFGKNYLKYDCVRIRYEGENLTPDFNLYDYALGFHYIEFDDRYLRFPHYLLYPEALEKAQNKHLLSEVDYAGHTKFCNYVISNALSAPNRQEMIELLNSYKTVDSGGKYNNNVGGPVPDKIEFEKNYKFTMTFENTSSNGYTTEKIMEGFAGATIPIYWGSPDIAKEFNPKAFINCHDFANYEDVLNKIKEIDNDDALFLSMVKEPIVVDDSQAARYFDENYLSDYLYQICSQNKEAAYRRNRYYIGKRYEEDAKMHGRLDRLLRFPKRVIYFLQNKLAFKK